MASSTSMPAILVVDDEKNIRLTVSRSLEPLGMRVVTAVNGEEALQKTKNEDFSVMLLDLKMSGIDGMEVLRRVRGRCPDLKVILISAHGTVTSAVEAMKLGAVDFVQKPFSPEEIRSAVAQALGVETPMATDEAVDPLVLIRQARRCLMERNFAGARDLLQKTIALDPGRPEAYNLLGAFVETVEGDRIEAQRYYRASLDMDPTYKPARENLDRATSFTPRGEVDLGPDMGSPPKSDGT